MRTFDKGKQSNQRMTKYTSQYLPRYQRDRDRCFKTINVICNIWTHPTNTTTIRVSWSLTSPFSTNMAISETKGQGWRAIPTQWRKASDILTSTLAAFLFSSHPKRERDREAHLNYYTSAYNRQRQLSHRKTKLNQIQQNTRINLN